jgi:hypothetical protein
MGVFDGNSLFIWKVKDCTGGHTSTSDEGFDHIIRVANMIGANYIPIKVADGGQVYNQLPLANGLYDPYAILDGLFEAFSKAGLRKVGWQYIYGTDPLAEVKVAIRLISRYGLEGYVLDPESEYKGRGASASIFMRELRKVFPDLPVALCSFRYPSYHPTFPWSEFLAFLDKGRGDAHMPQVYWEADWRDEAGSTQLARSFSELTTLKDLPVIPVAPCYGNRYGLRYWEATRIQLQGYLQKAKELGCPGVSYWVWDNIAQKEGRSPDALNPTTKGWWDTLVAAGKMWQKEVVTPEVPITLSWEESIDAWARSQGYSGPRPNAM